MASDLPTRPARDANQTAATTRRTARVTGGVQGSCVHGSRSSSFALDEFVNSSRSSRRAASMRRRFFRRSAEREPSTLLLSPVASFAVSCDANHASAMSRAGLSLTVSTAISTARAVRSTAATSVFSHSSRSSTFSTSVTSTSMLTSASNPRQNPGRLSTGTSNTVLFSVNVRDSFRDKTVASSSISPSTSPKTARRASSGHKLAHCHPSTKTEAGGVRMTGIINIRRRAGPRRRLKL